MQINDELWLLAELAPIQQRLIEYIYEAGLEEELSESLQESETIQTFDGSPLRQLCQRMDLSDFERQLLLLSLGALVMPQLSKLYTIIFANPQAGYPTFDLAMQLFPGDWQALTPQAPLRHWQLIKLQKTDSFMHSPYLPSERLLHYLYGGDCIDPRLTPYLTRLSLACIPAQPYQNSAQRLLRYWQRDNRQALVGQLIVKSSADAEQVAVHIAEQLSQPVWQLDLAALFADYDPNKITELQPPLERELLLADLILTINCDLLNERKQAPLLSRFIRDLVNKFPQQILLSARLPIDALNGLTFIEEVAEFGWAEQLALWQQGLAAQTPLMQTTLKGIVQQFGFSPQQIHSVTQQYALLNQDKSSAEVCPEGLWRLCRLQAKQQLTDKVQRIETKADWDDLVLPRRAGHLLQQLIDYVQNRHRLYYEWGFANKSSRGLNVVALFAGPSGTGKTMAAEVIAKKLHCDLLRVDLSSIISKYIGETEKNLSETFQVAEKSGAILLFDEADSLFARRTEVKDHHDRHANQQTSYLLQRIECFRGLCILTSNHEHSIDDAFNRRFHSVVHFDLPTKVQRAELWRKLLPEALPCDALDYPKLARYVYCGGEIHNIACKAAGKAAAQQTPLSMTHLLQAMQEESEKNEKPIKKQE